MSNENTQNEALGSENGRVMKVIPSRESGGFITITSSDDSLNVEKAGTYYDLTVNKIGVESITSQDGSITVDQNGNTVDLSVTNPPKDVFYAEINDTTYQEIKDAYDAGKSILAVDDDRIYSLYEITDSKFSFSSLSEYKNLEIYSCTSNNGWETEKVIAKADCADIADPYEMTTYEKGDLCYGGNGYSLYKADRDITTPESWNFQNWSSTTIADELKDIRSGMVDPYIGNFRFNGEVDITTQIRYAAELNTNEFVTAINSIYTYKKILYLISFKGFISSANPPTYDTNTCLYGGMGIEVHNMTGPSSYASVGNLSSVIVAYTWQQTYAKFGFTYAYLYGEPEDFYGITLELSRIPGFMHGSKLTWTAEVRAFQLRYSN